MVAISTWLIRAALLHFGAAAVFGGLILAEKGLMIMPEVWRLRPLHVDVMLTGWLIQFVIGVACWILPRFADRPRFGRVWLLWIAFAWLNGGVLLAASGAWWSVPALIAAGRVLQAGAVLAFIVSLWPRVKPMVFPG